MPIIRSERPKSNYTTIDNRVFAPGLSYAATGLLCFLLSKPDHWSVSVTALVNHAKSSGKPSGRDAVYALLNELISVGYIVRVQDKGQSGRLCAVDYMVHDTPQKGSAPLTDFQEADAPLTGSPLTAQPYTANPTLVNTDYKKRLNDSNSPASSPDADMPAPQFTLVSALNGSSARSINDDFDEFWRLYPRKKDKTTAFKAFAKVRKTVSQEVLIAALKAFPFDEREQFCKYPATWLNAGSYADDSVQVALRRETGDPVHDADAELLKVKKADWARNGYVGPRPTLETIREARHVSRA